MDFFVAFKCGDNASFATKRDKQCVEFEAFVDVVNYFGIYFFDGGWDFLFVYFFIQFFYAGSPLFVSFRLCFPVSLQFAGKVAVVAF